METIPCCICGSSSHTPVKARIDKDDYAPRIPTAPPVSRWVVCNGCGLVFQNPRPNSADMEAFYADGGYRQWTEVPEIWYGYSQTRPLPMMKWLESLPEIQAIIQGPENRRTIMDIGCGIGGSVKVFQDRGWRAYGCEPDSMLARSGRERFGINVAADFMKPELFPGVDFSLAFSIHVFEHLMDPFDVLQTAYSILESTQGYIFVAVPTYTHPGHPAWEMMNTGHTYMFTGPSLGNLMAKAGFRVTNYVYPKLNYHYCCEPSELWLLAKVDPSMKDKPLPYPEPVWRVQASLATVPQRAAWARAYMSMWRKKQWVVDYFQLPLLAQPGHYTRKAAGWLKRRLAGRESIG